MLRLATGYRVTSSVIPTLLQHTIRSFLTTLSRVEFMYLFVMCYCVCVQLCGVTWFLSTSQQKISCLPPIKKKTVTRFAILSVFFQSASVRPTPCWRQESAGQSEVTRRVPRTDWISSYKTSGDYRWWWGDRDRKLRTQLEVI